MRSHRERILVGVSGGIDSLSAVLHFEEQGYEPVPLFLMLSKYQSDIAENVKDLYSELGFNLIIADAEKEFKKSIIDYFTGGYRKGLTPNPCAMCNRQIKFPLLHNHSIKEKCGHFSTGHYIKVRERRIFKGTDENKDQSYFVSTVRKENLENYMSSQLADSTKEQTRIKIGSLKRNLMIQKESQEICFIQGDDYVSFLERDGGFKKEEGFFKNDEGEIIGRHHGFYMFTIGKRRNLKMGFNRRMYVKSIDSEKNTVHLTERKNLLKSCFVINPIEIFEEPESGVYTVKTRYRQKETECAVKAASGGRFEITLFEPVEAITPGQIAVLYKKDLVVLSGIITKEIW